MSSLSPPEEVRAGRGSQNSLPVEFGLGAATVAEQITIRWPSGRVQTIENIAADQVVAVIEPGIGDIDADTDVDLDDLRVLVDALSGPGQPTDTPDADVDFDGDCDREDYAQLTEAFDGA